MSENSPDTEPEKVFYLTPKGQLNASLSRYGFTFDEIDEVWDDLQKWCMKLLQITEPDAEFVALVFDDHGGNVVGISKTK